MLGSPKIEVLERHMREEGSKREKERVVVDYKKRIK